MRSIPILFVLLALTLPSLAAQGKKQARARLLNFQDVLLHRPRLPFPPRARWTGKGHTLRLGRELIDPASGRRSPAPPRAAPPRDASLRGRLLQALAAAGVEGAPGRLRRLAGGETRLFPAGGDLFAWNEKEGLTRLTADPDDPEELLAPSPDGRTVLLRKHHDLWSIALGGGTPTLRRITRDGGPERLYGRLDWVYQEEVYGRGRWEAYWWSPDGAWLAFLDLDTRREPRSPIVDSRPFRQGYRLQRYPKPGDPNARCLVRLAAAAGGPARLLDPRRWGGEEALVVRVDWGPGPALYLQVQDREQRTLSLVRWEPGGEARELLREERRDGWVRRSPPPRFLAGGEEFLWRSDRDGRARLYRYHRSGKLLGPVTTGPWQVVRLLAVGEERKELWCLGTEGMALERHLYRVPLAGGAGRRLTRPGRSHTISLSPDRTYFIDTWSRVDDPGGSDLCRAEEGRVVMELTRRTTSALAPYRLGRAELHQVPGPRGDHLNLLTLAPPGWEGGSRLPLWFEVYGGPGAQTVRNRWRLSPWHHFLAGRGIMVVRCDPRSASGRGHAHHLLCYQQLGREELRDLEACVAWLVKKGWADPDRVGITGVSYGGFLVNYALTHSRAFHCGVAVAGLSDWRNYDTIYTERYMRTPRANPAGYRLSSCLEAAKNLAGPLLLVHGEMDDNVHLANTLQLVDAFQRAGRQDFSLLVYPGNGHGIHRRGHLEHYRTRLWQFILVHLIEGR